MEPEQRSEWNLYEEYKVLKKRDLLADHEKTTASSFKFAFFPHANVITKKPQKPCSFSSKFRAFYSV